MITTCKTIALLLVMVIQVKGQSVPAYRAQSQSFKVPIELRGIAPDSANKQDDYYAYSFNGMLFQEEKLILPSINLGFNGESDLSNPFGLIASFWYGYQTANVTLLKSLLTDEGKAQLDAANYFDNIIEKSEAVRNIDTIRLIAAMELGDGVMIFTETKDFGIERNYLKKSKNQYYIVPLSDRSFDLIIQNFVLYLFYNPQPYSLPYNISYSDSVNIAVKTNFSASVSKEGSYVVIVRAGQEKPIIANVKDNSPVDRNPSSRQVLFPITLSYFLPKGENDVYVVESNFPVAFVTQTLLNNAKIIEIKVK